LARMQRTECRVPWRDQTIRNKGDFNGRRHGQMPGDRTRYSHRDCCRPQKLRSEPGLLRASLLPNLSDQSLVVCKQRLGMLGRGASAIISQRRVAESLKVAANM